MTLKKYIHFLALILLSLNLIGQNKLAADTSGVICMVPIVDEAEFPGGIKALEEFIKSNVRYPKAIIEKNIYGTCYVKFVVQTDGSIDEIEVLRGIKECPECDEEAKRLISIMPKWKPGKIDGELKATYFNLPFKFRTK